MCFISSMGGNYYQSILIVVSLFNEFSISILLLLSLFVYQSKRVQNRLQSKVPVEL